MPVSSLRLLPSRSPHEGKLVVPTTAHFAVVACRFNHFVVDALVDGAHDALRRHGATAEQIVDVVVPGAWELPPTLARLARSGKFDALVALGAVIRGTTAHFDYVAGAVAQGAARVQIETGVPVAFGVLTTDTIEQAIERAGTKAGNKGFEAAMVAIEMVTLFSSLQSAGY